MEKIIELKKVNKHYGGVHALKDVDFSLNQGEIHCLSGQNGCGKSTMIKVISGVIGVDPGSEVILDGKKSTGGLARQAMAAGVRVIYQDLSIFPNLDVYKRQGCCREKACWCSGQARSDYILRCF